MVGTGATTVAVISDPLESVDPQPAPWLDKDFLTIERPRTISATFPVSTNSWKLVRVSETNDWQLVDARANEKLDSSKISAVTGPFSSVNFSDVAPLEGNTNFNNSSSHTILTVQTFGGFDYVAKIGSKQDDNYPVNFSITTNSTAAKTAADDLARQKEFENWVYYLPGYSIDELLKLRNQLLVEVTNSVSAPTEK
jgi:hypothetical protein